MTRQEANVNLFNLIIHVIFTTAIKRAADAVFTFENGEISWDTLLFGKSSTR
jgi:hypothetical protein